ncbi:hypothetical protein MPSEU_000124000 [Mayamaea pseudoterrestris]|nr:hypothetical protein MPSEU_000124000 [Mayamaea pseudoterrestris]
MIQRLPNILLVALCAICSSTFLPSVAAAATTEPDVWMLTLLGKNDEDGNCKAQADEIGTYVQDTFNAAIPGITPYDPVVDDTTNSNRFLRSSSRRQLAIKLCARTYCSKPRNWDECYFSGCSCSCGRSRQLAVSASSDMAQVLKAKRDLDKWVTAKGVELGCELGLVMEKMRG